MGPDLVVAGNLVLDDIVYENGATRMARPGGAALYFALGAALWDRPVGLLAVAGENYPVEVLEELERRGVDLSGVCRHPGSGLRTWLFYEGRLRRVVHRLDSPPHAEMSPRASQLPAHWHPRAVHLAPMPLDIQAEWLANESEPGFLVSVDPFQLIDDRTMERCRDTFSQAKVLLLSEDELVVDGALDQPGPLLRRLASGALEFILFKRGARGGIVFDRRNDRLTSWPPQTSTVAEPTGAGDAFAGGLLAGLAWGEPMASALERAIVSASFALEGVCADGLLAATSQHANLRRAEWFT